MSHVNRSLPHIGPKFRTSPEPKPQRESYLEACFNRSKRLVQSLNAAVRTTIGYGDPAIEALCPRGEIQKATARGWTFVATPVVMGTLALLAADSLTGSFSIFNCVACYGVTAWVAAADAVILHSWTYHRGLGDLSHGGAYFVVPSHGDTLARRIVAFRIGWSITFGFVLSVGIGIATNASAIDRRLIEDDLARNAPLVQLVQADFNSQIDSRRASLKSEQSEVARLTKLRQRRNNSELESRIALEQQKRDQDEAALNDLLASRPERLQRALMAMPSYIPQSHDSIISRVRGYAEVAHADPLSAAPAILAEVLIIGVDVFNLCLGGLGSLGAYPARTARRRLEELTEEARAAVANMGGDDEGPPEPTAGAPAAPPPPPRPGTNGAAMPRRGRGRPRKSETAPPASSEPHAA
jgi:hypothetical protein